MILVEENWVRLYLSKLNLHKFMSPDVIRAEVLRELANVIARPRSLIFQQSLQLGKNTEG